MVNKILTIKKGPIRTLSGNNSFNIFVLCMTDGLLTVKHMLILSGR